MQCEACDWRGVPTLSCERLRYKGRTEKRGARVFVGCGVEVAGCPCCGGLLVPAEAS